MVSITWTFINVKTKKIACWNILDSENPYHTETDYSQIDFPWDFWGFTVRDFSTGFKSAYWQWYKNITKSHKNAAKHLEFKWCNYGYENSSNFIQHLTQQFCVKLAVKYRKVDETIIQWYWQEYWQKQPIAAVNKNNAPME